MRIKIVGNCFAFCILAPALALITPQALGEEANSFDPYAASNAQGHYLLPALVTTIYTPAPQSKTVINTPAPQTVPAPLPAPIIAVQPYNWTGTYVGVQFGGGIGTTHTNYISHGGIPYVHGGTTGDVGVSSILGGFTIGHNEQFGNFVAGFETDFSVNDVMGSVNEPNPAYVYKVENPWLTTFRPRLGYAFGRFMPYVTGGMALGDVRYFAGPNTGGLGSGSDFTDTEIGWTAGTGIEAALSPQWSVKAEYLYVQLADAKGISVNDELTSSSFNEHIARIGLNYKFDQPNTPAEFNMFNSPETSGDPISLATLTGFEIGGQVSSYRYQEHEVADQTYMHESGAHYGITATATQGFNSGFFASADSRIAYGQNHYVGNGTLGGLPDYLGEIRALFGKDLMMSSNESVSSARFDISPYVGLGYRYLYNDFRGTRSNGSTGYRRDSQYLYIPVGVTPRFRITDDARISTNFEFDQLVEGWQTTDLTDRSPTLPNLTTGQNGGYGLRGSIMYERTSWGVGPFFDYWNINQSSTACEGGTCEFEPHNQTIEYGLQARYRF